MKRSPLGVRGSLFVFAAAAALGGCQASTERTEPAPASMGVVNDLCPIGKDPVNMGSHPAALTRQYQGQNVGFCCDGCVVFWDGMSEKEKAEGMASIAKDGHAPGFKAR